MKRIIIAIAVLFTAVSSYGQNSLQFSNGTAIGILSAAGLPGGVITTFTFPSAGGTLLTSGSLSGAAWLTNGNTLTGTLPGTPTEFFGSINAADVIFKTASTERLRILSTGGVRMSSLGAGIVHSDASGNLTSSAVALADIAPNAGPAILVTNGGVVTWYTLNLSAGTFSGNGVDLPVGLSNDAVSFGQMQNMATGRLLGRTTAGSGDIEEIATNASLTLSGLTLGLNLANANTWTATQTFSAVGNGIVVTTNADLQGNIANSTGNVTVNDNLSITGAGNDLIVADDVLLNGAGSVINNNIGATVTIDDNLTTNGSITTSGAGTDVTSIDDIISGDDVSVGDDIHMTSATSIIDNTAGRVIVDDDMSITGGIANVGGGAVVIDDLQGLQVNNLSSAGVVHNDAAGLLSTSLIVSGDITDGTIAYADIQDVSDNRLLGNSSGASGPMMEITVSGGLTLVGGVLSGSGGTVTNVTATLPLSSTNGATPDISISQAGTLSDGYLSSTDWNIFDGKQDALTLGSLTTSTSGVTVGGSGNTVGANISVDIATAATGVTGLLTGSDWDMFNGKLSTVSTTGSTLTGDGTSGTPLAVVDNTSTQRVRVSKAGTLTGTRQEINFIEGSNVTITTSDNGGSDRVDVTIAAAGGTSYSPMVATQASAQTVAETTTLDNSTDLTFSLAASTNYWVDGFILIHTNGDDGADVKIAFDYTGTLAAGGLNLSGVTSGGRGGSNENTCAPFYWTTSGTGIRGNIDEDRQLAIHVSGVVKTSTSGNLRLQFAVFLEDGGTDEVILEAGSGLRVTPY